MKQHIHYKAVQPQPEGMEHLLEQATKINTTSWTSVNALSPLAPKAYTGYRELVQACLDFKCDRCGESFGPVTSWGVDRAIVLDSLTGLNTITMGAVKGSGIATSLPQYGAAMGQEMAFIQALLQAKTHFICIGHLTRGQDDLGQMVVATDLLGAKNGAGFPSKFGEVYYPFKDGTGGYYWDANNGKVTTKTRLFGAKENIGKLTQDFAGPIGRWRKLGMNTGIHVLIHGDPGTGKSWSIGSLMRAGIQPFVLLTEEAAETYHLLDVG